MLVELEQKSPNYKMHLGNQQLRGSQQEWKRELEDLCPQNVTVELLIMSKKAKTETKPTTMTTTGNKAEVPSGRKFVSLLKDWKGFAWGVWLLNEKNKKCTCIISLFAKQPHRKQSMTCSHLYICVYFSTYMWVCKREWRLPIRAAC